MKTLVFEKGKSYKFLTNKYQDFRDLVSKYHGLLDIENCEYDYKLHRLDVGECPCRPIWHYDGTNNPTVDPEVQHALFLTGTSYCPTLFFKETPVLVNSTEKNIHDWHNDLEKTQETFPIHYDVWTLYTSKTIHRASHAETAGERLLIRIKERILK